MRRVHTELNPLDATHAPTPFRPHSAPDKLAFSKPLFDSRSVSVLVSASVRVSLTLSTCLPLSIYLSIYLCIYLSISLSISLSIYLCLDPSIPTHPLPA
jgi:hypothetical protein